VYKTLKNVNFIHIQKLKKGRKNMKEKLFKNKNGITLIALVITIIVMLILVAVTITVAVNRRTI